MNSKIGKTAALAVAVAFCLAPLSLTQARDNGDKSDGRQGRDGCCNSKASPNSPGNKIESPKPNPYDIGKERVPGENATGYPKWHHNGK